MSAIFERVQRFRDALDLALYDRELEDAGKEVQIFYDTDVAVDIVLGLTSWDRSTPPPDVSGPEYVVRALMSTRCLPPIRLLRPHLVEFDRVIRRLPIPTGMMDGFHRATINHLIRQWQLSSSEEDLRKRLDSGGGSGFYNFLREHGYGVFVKVELCLGGTWRDRLRRLLKAGRFQIIGDGAAEPIQAADPDAVAFSQRMESLRQHPQHSINNQVDAHALAELARRLKRGIHARFYTGSESVRSLFASLDPELRARLFDERPVERVEEYFLIRSSFPAVGFRDSDDGRQESTGASAAALFTAAELRRWVGEITNILAGLSSLPPGEPGRSENGTPDADWALETALRSVTIGDMNLAEMIERFYNLGFLDSVFLSWDPKEIQDWLPTLYEAKSEDSLVAGVRRKLGMSMDELWETLGREIGSLRDWCDDFQKIAAASEAKARGSRGSPFVLDVDLGLGRWGMEDKLEGEPAKRLTVDITGLLDHRTRSAFASNLAINLAYRTPDLQEFSHQIYLLWFLGLDGLIIRSFENAADMVRTQIPPWLELLHLVARTRTARERIRRGAQLDDELTRLAEEAAQNIEHAQEGGWDPGFAEMGLAHVCYWAWHVTGHDTQGSGLKWARKSFEAARRATELLERGSLGWAFAINHCAYVGIRARLEPEATEWYLETLLESIPRNWYHYRFADTEVRAVTERVNRAIHHHGIEQLTSDPALGAERALLCSQLTFAEQRLEELPNWGDSEVLQHLRSIRRHLNDLGCSPGAIRADPASVMVRPG